MFTPEHLQPVWVHTHPRFRTAHSESQSLRRSLPCALLLNSERAQIPGTRTQVLLMIVVPKGTGVIVALGKALEQAPAVVRSDLYAERCAQVPSDRQRHQRFRGKWNRFIFKWRNIPVRWEKIVTFNGKFSNGDGVQSQKRVRSAVRGRQKIFFRSEWLEASGISVVMWWPPFGGLNAAKKGCSKHNGVLKNRYVAAEF